MTNFKTVYIYAPHAEERKRVKPELETLFNRLNIEIIEDKNTADIIASVGGDGAFLKAVRDVNFRDDCVYLGIATANKTHFYADFHLNNLQQLEEAFLRDNFDPRKYPTIEVRVNDNQPLYCLNEFTIRSSIIKTIRMDLYINDFLFEQFMGDGIVVSTPTGSTGYNKSLGGAIVDPLIHAIQITELASVNSNTHRTLGTSFLLEKERPLTILVDKQLDYYPLLALDNEALGVINTDKIVIRVSDKFIHTLRMENNTFWHKTKRNFLQK